MDERRQAVFRSIEEQGKLTPELQAQIGAAATMTALEDLYAPYKPKRRTRASIAKEKGLQPLADLILNQARSDQSLDNWQRLFSAKMCPRSRKPGPEGGISSPNGSATTPKCGGSHVRKRCSGACCTAKKLKRQPTRSEIYELYYEFELRVDKLRPHQVLALNRGETEKVLRVKVIAQERDWRNAVEAVIRPDPRSPLAGQLQQAMDDSAERLLLPSIERDVRRELSEKAERHAIGVFAENLRALLSQPPLAGQTVLGIDPGFRTGCKVAVVDPTGKLLETTTIYPHEPQKEWAKALETLAKLAARYQVTLITIGNGTASRETEQLAAELIRKVEGLRYLIVNEAGASCTAPARWRGPRCPNWMSACAGRSRSPAAPRTRWPSWSRSIPGRSVWVCTSTMSTRNSSTRAWPGWWRAWSTRWAWT